MNIWPASLPQAQFIGAAIQAQPNVIRTPMEAGVAKTRRRFSSTVRTLVTPISLTGAQRAVFDAFYSDDLMDGALPFQWEDLDDVVVNMRFTSPPSFTLESGGSVNARVYRSTLSLEILP